ncbi:hypothetical protein CORC01_03066 [Colletotrichum orchidophilum]|uniref:Uncharacterized protein n=1 Tax=Colletotrichum orchidophilum TaxID=1209926 RepID=A0A1G4BJT4_9PEZI|nr:uncharacterized protein CORC01_03066 [Colletotrichum orchidophilum]OHF01576.1 hypothetical protein CORC01_03066 [Colletotrichum orchidophilum]
MDQRSRGGRPNRRKTLPTSSIQSDTSAGGESNSSIMTRSPPVAASRTPQTAPPNRRNAKPIPMNNPFSVRSSPSTGGPGPGKALRKRSRTSGFDGPADEEDETYRKGPHTLRKRAKIDYSAADFEDELPEIAIPAPRTATRKKRADSEVVDDEYFTPTAQKRRANSREFSVASITAARRRTPARKNVVEQQSFYSQQSDEDIVKDTIEVVGDSSDLISSDDASDHEDDNKDISGHISLQENLDQPSSPIQRKTQAVLQLASPIDHQIIKQDERQSSQAQNVADGIVAAADIVSGPIIAHPQPIRVNQVTIIENTGPRPDTEATTTHHGGFAEDFSFQPKREASSPVRPAESLPQRTALPEAAESANTSANTDSAVVPGAQENSAPPVTQIFNATNNDQVNVAQPIEQPQESIAPVSSENTKVNGHVEAIENELPPHNEPSNSQFTAASHDADVSVSFTTQSEELSRAQDEMDVDVAEEPDAETQDDVPVPQPKASSPQPQPAATEAKKKRYAWSHLTPYIDGEYVTHSIYPVAVEASAPTSNADAAEASGERETAEETPEHAAANADAQGAEGDVEDGANVDADGEVDDAERDAEHDEDLAHDSQGQQLSQGSAYNSAAPTPALTPRQGSPVLTSAATGTSTPALLMPKQRFRKQYKFKKVRDPAEFLAFLKDSEDLPQEQLWDLLAQANECLLAYQEEYKECSRIVDDQENAQRRAIQDAAYEKKTADLNAFAKVDSYMEKEFEVQGSRATIKEKDAGILEQRLQDRIMAATYHFEYDPHPNKVGNQDPGAQKGGGGEGVRQLRSQPQASAKAAEGDGVIVSGKRTRNPPKLFDGVLQDDHRAATPGTNKPGPKKRGRAAAADKAASAQDHEEEPEPEPQTVSPAKPGPKKRGPRGRKSAVVISEPSTPVPEEEAIASPPEPEQAQPPKRKRGRQPKSAAIVEEAPEEPEKPTPKRGRAAKRQSNGHVAIAPETTDESRPTSSSSMATISDAGSTYGLRQKKRQRNWQDDDEVDEEEVEAEPQPKKARIIRINRKQSAPELAPKQTMSEQILADIHRFSASLDAPDSPQPRLMVSFRLIGNRQWTMKPAASPRQTSTDVSEYNLSTSRPAPMSAPTSAKSSAPPSQAEGEEKDYSTMTKSEKMSASMKKRWLNGSMQGAVNKRKATLAAKKAAAAAAEAEAARVAQQKAMQLQQSGQPAPFPMGQGQ